MKALFVPQLWSLILALLLTLPAVAGTSGEQLPRQLIIGFDSNLKTDPLKLIYSTGLKSLNPSTDIVAANPVCFAGAKGKAKVNLPTLRKIYRLDLKAGIDVDMAVKEYKAVSGVTFAEPVYVYHLNGTPNDPLFSQQWYLANQGQFGLVGADVEAPAAWDVTQGTSDTTIAVIDTGIDLSHPDLAPNLWLNSLEAAGDANHDGRPGIANYDDDGDGLIDEDSAGRQPGDLGYANDLVSDDDENGFNDDFHGWNWVDHNANAQDVQGHGTHVSGILGAATNNGQGIAGMCPQCRIMPLKVFQSDGTANTIDIAQAVIYAAQAGAKVINMSFGGPNSALLENALESASSQAVLVAAAGNGGEVEGPRYPAAYSFVIGVGATTVGKDPVSGLTAETIAEFTNTTNAKIYAPGDAIRSTLPGNQYASWSGTSMATPVVSGIAGLIVSHFKGGFWTPALYTTQILNAGAASVSKIVWKNGLPNVVTGNRISAYRALSMTPVPVLGLDSTRIDDSAGNGDGAVNAGEVIDLYATIRNLYGNATNVTLTLTTSDSLVTILDGAASMGSIGPLGLKENTGDKLRFQVDGSASNNRVLLLQLAGQAGNGGAGFNTTLRFVVQRGATLGGIITSDTVLTPDRDYIVTSNMLVNAGVTLTIEAGTTLRFAPDTKLVAQGTLRALGTAASPILFTSNDANPLPAQWRYVELAGPGYNPGTGAGSIVRHCIVEYSTGLKVTNNSQRIEACEIRYCGSIGGSDMLASYGGGLTTFSGTGNFVDCYVHDNEGYYGGAVCNYGGIMNFAHSLFTDNASRYLSPGDTPYYPTVWTFSGATTFSGCTFVGNRSVYGGDYSISMTNCNFINNRRALDEYVIQARSNTLLTDAVFASNYWGTTDITQVNSMIYDYNDTFDRWTAQTAPLLNGPSPLAPPVVANYALMPGPLPLGQGQTTLTLTFSADMSTTSPISVSFGPADPYTQHPILGRWKDIRTWVGAFEVSLFTGDGQQHIRVVGGRGSDGMVCPAQNDYIFSIETAGVAGVNLQASPEPGHINLFFHPIQEPDLAGYNIYRSNYSGGGYVKLNSAVVVDTTYTDLTAPEAVMEYYIVRAVRTDFSESPASNEAHAAALDGTPPTLTSSAVVDADDVAPGITIQANATDNSGVASVVLYYRVTGDTSYTAKTMTHPTGTLYSANIPGSAITLAGLDYYIVAYDPIANQAQIRSAAVPQHVLVYTKKAELDVPTGNSQQVFGTTDLMLTLHNNNQAAHLTVYRLDVAPPSAPIHTIPKHWQLFGLASGQATFDVALTYTPGDLAGLNENSIFILMSAGPSQGYTTSPTTRNLANHQALGTNISNNTVFSLTAQTNASGPHWVQYE